MICALWFELLWGWGALQLLYASRDEAAGGYRFHLSQSVSPEDLPLAGPRPTLGKDLTVVTYIVPYLKHSTYDIAAQCSCT